MKNFTLLILLAFSSLISFAQESDDKVELSTEATPKIEFETKTHDFGRVEEGVQATYTFTFKNTGDAPLVLNTVKASCSCTTPKWTRKPIAPGETGTITAVYDSKGRIGNFTKTITVTHNGESGTTYLTLRGIVVKTEAQPPTN